MPVLFAALSGLVFGFGLILSEMINPTKIANFLDLFGNWDPSLIFVMGAGLLVTGIGYRLAFRQSKPLFADGFQLPTRTDIDARLVAGAAMFGIGWGVAGLCPGPALTALTIGGTDIVLFLAAMFAGMAAQKMLMKA